MAKPAGFEVATEEAIVEEKPSISYESIEAEEVLLKNASNQLPIGVFCEGCRLTSFALKPYTGEEEIALSTIATRFQDRVADVLPQFLSQIVDSIGGIKVEELAKNQSLSVVRFFEQMFLADALTLLLQLRMDNYGEEVKLAGQCPNCQTHNKDREGEYSDLGTVKLNMPKSFEHPIVEYKLQQPVRIFEDTITRILIRPVRVYDMKRMSNTQKNDKRIRLKLQHEILLHTIVSVPECGGYGNSLNEDRSGISLSGAQEIYKRLGARDRDTLVTKAVQKLSDLGPEMTCQMSCEACLYEFPAQVPWRDIPMFLSFAT